MGMLRRQNTMSALLFWLPNVLWETLRHGGLSIVPSILVTCRQQDRHVGSKPMLPFPLTPFTHSYVVVVLRHVDKSGQTLAEPHGDLPVHVDSEGFETFLKPAHGVILEGAGIFAQIHASYLCQAKAADGNKPCRPNRERGEKQREEGP